MKTGNAAVAGELVPPTNVDAGIRQKYRLLDVSGLERLKQLVGKEFDGWACERWVEEYPALPWLLQSILGLAIKLLGLDDTVGEGARGRVEIDAAHHLSRRVNDILGGVPFVVASRMGEEARFCRPHRAIGRCEQVLPVLVL